MKKKTTAIAFRPPRYVPAFLSIAAVALGILISFWWLIAIPFAIIGSSCAVPGTSHMKGLPAYVSIILGVMVTQFHLPSGLAVIAGAAGGFYGSALEMRLLNKPVRK